MGHIGKVHRTPDCDDKGTDEIVEEIADRIGDAVLSEDDLGAEPLGKETEGELHEFPDDAECQHEQQDEDKQHSRGKVNFVSVQIDGSNGRIPRPGNNRCGDGVSQAVPWPEEAVQPC